MTTSKISTKNIPSPGSVPKLIQPGNRTVKILSVLLEKFPFREGGYHVILNVEGPDLGAEYDGFFVDKNDPAKGKYSGQIGKIKAGEYAFSDNTTKTGVAISRDKEMLKFLSNFCKDLGIAEWFDKQDDKHETIEALYEQFNSDKPFAEKWVRMCVAGKEYINGQGYTNYDLFMPKSSAKAVAVELESVPEASSRII